MENTVTVSMEELTVEDYLSFWEDNDRDRMRDFMNNMNWGFDFQLDKNPTPLEDELEYKDRVYKYYVWSIIQNHYLISKLINDREGRSEIPLNEMSIGDFLKDLNDETTQTYNRYVLNKDIPNWDEPIDLNTNF
tara:strand:+ start:494 stop:895 length:402 start_codon:yes stop_codon:yes gene_type:complete